MEYWKNYMHTYAAMLENHVYQHTSFGKVFFFFFFFFFFFVDKRQSHAFGYVDCVVDMV